MLRFRFPLLLIILFTSVQLFSQDKVKIDSLEKLLRKVKIDSVKVDLLNQLFREHLHSDTSIARDFANQSYRLSERSGYTRGIADYYLNLANLDVARGNYRQARNNIQRFIDLYEDLGDMKAAAGGYHAMGFCLFNLQDYHLSLEYYNEALKIREEIRDTSGLIESYGYLGYIYNRRGNHPRALDHYRKLLDIHESTGNKTGLADCYSSIGWTLGNQGDHAQALEYHNNALETLVELGDSGRIASVFNYIGILYNELSDYPQAIGYFQKSLKIRQSLGDSSAIADCLNNIGLIYEYQGDYPRALDMYFETRSYREKMGDKSRLGLCFHNIGNVYYKMDDTARALNYYQQSLAIRTELGERGSMAGSYIGLGNVNLDKAEYTKALENYHNALEISREFGDKINIVICLMNIAQVKLMQENYPVSLETYQEALELAEEIGNVRRTALINAQIGYIYKESKDYNKAIFHALKGYELGSSAGVIDAMRDAAEYLAASYAAIGSYRKAYDYYILFKTMSDSLLNEENIRTITAKENQYQFEKEKQAAELENLKREELHEAEVKKQQILRNAFIGAFVLMIIIATLILRSYRQKQKANIALQEKNTYISQQKEEIEQQKEELKTTNEELQSTLDNLKHTQVQLIQSEKLASLGGLVAGVAHEINTPVGIGVTAVSSLMEDTQKMADLYKKEQINRKDFKEFLQTTNNSAKLIQKNLERTAQLVQSFKQVSTDQSTEEQRQFLFKAYTEDVIRSLYPKFKNRNIEINIDCDEKLKINSFPGIFAQVFTNLVLNSITHGFRDDRKGEIDIIAKEENSNLGIEYKDNGAGIPENILPKIFDPFFTTDQSQGTGLGLNIVYNLITQKLNGIIECESEIEKGVKFNIIIPISA